MADMKDDDTSGADDVLPPQSVTLGNFKVTALRDGYFDLPMAYFIGLQPDAGSLAPQSMHIDVNAFLIEMPDRKVLVDTGCGDKLGPTVNRLLESLGAAGVSPSEIDTILCTHIHPDHTNGLIDAIGDARFANAEVVVQQDELAFWLSAENRAAAPDELKPQFDMAQAAFAPYANRLRTFGQNEDVAKGISAVPLYGHTAGHSGYLLDAGGNQQMLIWGDCVHAIDLQTQSPDVTFAADMDKDAARATRLRLFDQVASDNIMVTGMHVTFPGFGHIARSGGKFDYNPSS